MNLARPETVNQQLTAPQTRIVKIQLIGRNETDLGYEQTWLIGVHLSRFRSQKTNSQYHHSS